MINGSYFQEIQLGSNKQEIKVAQVPQTHE